MASERLRSFGAASRLVAPVAFGRAVALELEMPRVLLEVVSVPLGRAQSSAARAVAGSGETIRLGRGADCDLSFPMDTTASREHCQVTVNGDVIELVDSSTYGTSVNGRPVTNAVLFNGDQIEFGQGIVVSVHVDPDEEDAAGDEGRGQATIAYVGPTESLSNLCNAAKQGGEDDKPTGYQIEFLSANSRGNPLDRKSVV